MCGRFEVNSSQCKMEWYNDTMQEFDWCAVALRSIPVSVRWNDTMARCKSSTDVRSLWGQFQSVKDGMIQWHDARVRLMCGRFEVNSRQCKMEWYNDTMQDFDWCAVALRSIPVSVRWNDTMARCKTSTDVRSLEVNSRQFKMEWYNGTMQEFDWCAVALRSISVNVRCNDTMAECKTSPDVRSLWGQFPSM